jgi:DNA topoisomerase-1
VKQGKLNASLPEGSSADAFSLEQAVELLAAKAASGKGGGKARTGSRTATKAAGKAAGAKAAAKTAGKTAAAKAGATPKPPSTTKTGRLRASAVRVIRPEGG